jgi:hypothetical protein
MQPTVLAHDDPGWILVMAYPCSGDDAAPLDCGNAAGTSG